VIDELAFYCNSPDRKLSQEFAGRLRDLVSRGRAAGDHRPGCHAEAG